MVTRFLEARSNFNYMSELLRSTMLGRDHLLALDIVEKYNELTGGMPEFEDFCKIFTSRGNEINFHQAERLFSLYAENFNNQIKTGAIN